MPKHMVHINREHLEICSCVCVFIYVHLHLRPLDWQTETVAFSTCSSEPRIFLLFSDPFSKCASLPLFPFPSASIPAFSDKLCPIAVPLWIFETSFIRTILTSEVQCFPLYFLQHLKKKKKKVDS